MSARLSNDASFALATLIARYSIVGMCAGAGKALRRQ
jgi:hypothetical protein